MDNDNKIKKETLSNAQRHSEVLLFLNKELESLKKGSNTEIYNIETEYAKTKKHRSPFTFFLLFAVFFVVLAVAFISYKVISYQNNEIKVNLTEFDDLNLKNLLDSVSKVQNSYDSAVKSKASLEAEQNRLLKEAEEKRNNEFFVLDNLKLEGDDYKKRESEINKIYSDEINSINLEYEPKITEMNSQIEVYQKQLAEYDGSKIQSAQEQEKAINSERQLHQLEIQELTQNYESQISELEKVIEKNQNENTKNIRKSVKTVQEKYQAEIDALDPIINDSMADKLISKTDDFSNDDFDASSVIEKNSISDENLVENLNQYQEFYDDYQYLNSKVSAIPQKHTIPSYVAANNSYVKQMGTTFSSVTTNLYQQNENLKNQISGLEKEILENEKYSEQIYTEMLTASKANALIYFVNSVDDIQIFIAERARYLVDESDGLGAEFTIEKKTVKGRIYKENNVFRFHINDDLLGYVDISTFLPGTIVKLLKK